MQTLALKNQDKKNIEYIDPIFPGIAQSYGLFAPWK